KAADICQHFALAEESVPLLEGDPAPADFLTWLAEAQQFRDAIRFLAHAMPQREAVWWGALCHWHALDARADRLPPQQRAALRAAVVWALEPSEANRRAAEAPGRAADLTTAAGCLAMG